MPKTYQRCIAILLFCTSMVACGWQLRGYEGGKVNQFSAFKEVSIRSDDRYTAFFKVLSKTMQRNGVSITNTNPLKLAIARENMERKPLAFGSTGVPAQYELILSVEYSVSRENETLISTRQMISRRFYDFDPDLVIEKDREQEDLVNEMREDIAQRLILAISRAL